MEFNRNKENHKNKSKSKKILNKNKNKKQQYDNGTNSFKNRKYQHIDQDQIRMQKKYS